MKDYYCSAIDTGLFVSVNGGVGLCCSGDGFFGSVRQQPIQEIFTANKFTQLQQDLHTGQSNDYCKGCYKIENTAPGSSQWSAFNDQFQRQTQRQLKLIDIRWSNVCNLTCRYCNTHDSSEWRKIRNLPIESVNRDYTESLFDLVEENLHSIEVVYLLGGEPLLQKHNIRLLDMLPKHVKIDILTNGSVDLINNKVYEKLTEFKNTYWNLSFDNVADRFEYVRAGSNWNLLCNNINILKQDFTANNVTFHPVYSIFNATRLKELYDFSDRCGSLRINWQLALATVDPYNLPTDSFLIFGHNREIINLALEEIDQLDFDDYFLSGVKTSLQDNITDPTKSQKFLNWIDQMEQTIVPKYSFQALWPELNTLLNK